VIGCPEQTDNRLITDNSGGWWTVNVRATTLFLFLAVVAANAFAVTTPVILSLDPPAAIAGTSSFTLTVNGANFVSGAQVRVNGSGRGTSFVSSSKLTATLFFGDVANPGTLQITVASGGAVSAPVNFVVYPNDPQIASFDPVSTAVNTSNPVVTINGSNFGSTAVVRINGTSRPTTYVSPTQLTFTLSDSDVAHTGNLTVNVLNPNNKLSPAATYTITQASTAPTITILSPSTVTANGPQFTLSITGTNFVSGSIVKANTASRLTHFVDSTHLTATILASDIKTPGSVAIVVNNPNGQISSAATLTVTSGTLPTITSLSPSSVTVGSPQFTLTITGTNFTSNATVTVGNATPRNVTFVDAQHVKVNIFTSDVNTVGSVPITVTVPGTTGGTSSSFNLFVTAFNAPVINSLNPSTLAVNSTTLKVLVNGSNFLFDDILQVDGTTRVTEFISATQMALTLLASDVASAHTSAVTAKRKDNSSTSAPATLTIVDAVVPAITAITPTTQTVGSTQPVIVVSGQNFTSTSIVTVDGSPRVTEYVSPTELHATLTGSDLATAHDVLIAVVANSGTSASVTYSIVVPLPTITSITPSSVIAGDVGFQLTVTGTNFSPTSLVNINGSPRATSQNPTTGALTANVSASEIETPGTLQISVSDNGVSSSPTPLTVFSPQITGVTPNAILAGVLSQDVTVTGSGFLPSSKIVFKGNELVTVLNPDGSLTATINGSDLINPGTFAVNVRNSPTATSAPVFVQVVSGGTPRIDSLDPSTFSVGAGVDTLRVLGGNFVPLSVVRINGTDRTTQYVSTAELRATLLPSDLSAAQTLHVTVRNPDGTTSAEVLLIVTPAGSSTGRRRAVRH
jgi:hypothetical protein